MIRFLPFPLMSLALLALWLLLVGSTKPASLLMGALLALAGGFALALLAPPRARLRRLRPIPGLLRDIAIEILRSNNAVARIILRRERDGIRQSGFVTIPLTMRNPYGLAALACILTATPGTVWVDYDAKDGTMLLHVLDLLDPEDWVRIVKHRWEARLMEIFE